MAEYTPMIKQYLSVKNEYQDCFLFFRLGDFYELFFEDAQKAAKILEITLTGRGKDGEKIPMCGIPFHTADPYIKKMIDQGYKVAICEQVEDPKLAKGVVKREVTRVITPGTVMETNLLAETENNMMLFIHKKDSLYALVGCDLSTGEVTGTEIGSLELLIEEMKHFKVAEIILSDDLLQVDSDKISNSFQACVTQSSILSSTGEAHTSDAHANHLVNQDVYKIDRNLSISIRETLLFMYQYLLQTQKKAIDHLQPFRFYKPTSFLILDANSKRNLELTETIRDRSREGSLLWLVDETLTAMGGRLLKKWIQRPLVQQEQIEQRIGVVSVLFEQALLREELIQCLDQVYDLERLAARVSYGNVNPKDLIQLKKSLQVMPEIVHILKELRPSYIQNFMKQIDTCPDLVDLLETSVVEDPPFSVTDGDIFQTGYHEELDRFREASTGGKQWIAELEAQERKETGIKSLKVGFNRVFGYYIEVTKANVHLLEDDRYERKQTLTNAERYITPELKEKESLILDASDRSTDLEYELFTELREQVNAFTERLQQLANVIAQIDCFCSFAQVSEQNHYVRPIFSSEKLFHLQHSRHPVVEKMMDAAHFVANDVVMNESERQILLITGPNMAGKSTYMRQMALIVIMAQMGCFVPADKAILPIFDRIFTRIGAADDLAGGQSTFMVEMMEAKQAITQATPDSLILLDEIGRGTATYDGMSLAQAVVEYIHDHVQAKTLFSTHYHELTDLEMRLDKLTNVHVACSEKDGRVIFLHKVQEGKTDRSYGIQVAQLADMPIAVIRRATEILHQLEYDSAKNRETVPVQQLSLFSTLDVEEGIHTEGHFSRTIESSKQDEQKMEWLTIQDERLACLKEIEELDTANLTPLEALNKLYDVQQKLKHNQQKLTK